MRFVKLGKQNFKTLEEVRRFFLQELPRRTPRGKFRVKRKYDLEFDEPIVFSYQARVVFTAQAGSKVLPNYDIEHQEYPFYFVVKLATLREADEDLHDIEQRYNDAAETTVGLVGRTWNELTDSVHTEEIWNRLRRRRPSINVEDQDLTNDEIDRALWLNRLRFGIVPTDTQHALVRLRKGQARLHELTLKNYGSRCAVCDIADRALLIASHVVGWAKAPEHRGDLSNVICLCRLHDALFEAGYWSLGDRLRLLKKKSVTSKTIRQVLDAMTSFRLPLEFPPAAQFVKRHREQAGLAVADKNGRQ